MKTEQVAALLNPTSVAILGARENPSGWTARIFANFARFGFEGPVWPVNPNHDEIWGGPCYASLDALPGTPDHLVVMRAADAVPGILREAAAAGARSATLYATGFSEQGTDEGRRREDELRDVLDETGIAISGPNCLGNLSARARLLTQPDDRLRELVPGPVAMVGQSGTTTPAIGRLIIDRGIDMGYVVTSGNEVGLTAADYISYFLTDPDIRVIFCLIEAVRRPSDFLDACRAARDAGKPVVAIKMGGSAQAREAALAHTGSMAGSHEAFDAVAGEAGVIRVNSADEAADVIDFLIHAPMPTAPGVGVVTYSGGVRGLAADAAERHGIAIPAFSDQTVRRMRDVLGEDFPVSNPLDATGLFAGGAEVVVKVLDAVLADPGIGTVLVQEDLPPGEGHNDANRRRARRVIETMEMIEQKFLGKPGAKPIALSSATSSELTEFSRVARKRFPHIALLNEPERAMRALRRILDYRDSGNGAGAGKTEISGLGPVARRLEEMARAADGPVPLDEVQSKALLREYGIPVPVEEPAKSAADAVAAAVRIGCPVVLKGMAAALTHKSDAGAVALGLTDADAVERAYASIHANVAAYDPGLELDGVLVAQAVSGGLELVIGIDRDPEMGPVVMFGMGGVWLELFKDVAFAPPALDRDAARRMIARTRAGTLLAGYRGVAARDTAAVVDALVAAGRLARDLGHVIQSLDINPFTVLAEGQGGVALDALMVLRGRRGG